MMQIPTTEEGKAIFCIELLGPEHDLEEVTNLLKQIKYSTPNSFSSKIADLCLGELELRFTRALVSRIREYWREGD